MVDRVDLKGVAKPHNHGAGIEKHTFEQRDFKRLTEGLEQLLQSTTKVIEKADDGNISDELSDAIKWMDATKSQFSELYAEIKPLLLSEAEG